MNTSALVTRLLHLAARPFVLLLGFLKKVALALFGRVQWSPPRWLSQSRSAFSRFNRAHPVVTASGIIVILLLLDRKSTRLNSSHTVISYAVFCLKKKKNNN